MAEATAGLRPFLQLLELAMQMFELSPFLRQLDYSIATKKIAS